MVDDILKTLEAAANKKKKQILPRHTIIAGKGSFSVNINGNYTGSAQTVATAQLICIITGASRWQVEALATDYPDEIHIEDQWFECDYFLRRSAMQKMSYDEYIDYLKTIDYESNPFYVQTIKEIAQVSSDVKTSPDIQISRRSALVDRINHIKFMIDHDAADNIQPLVPGHNTFLE